MAWSGRVSASAPASIWADAEVDGRLLEPVQDQLGLVRVVQGQQQEALHAEAVVGQRPRPHGLADHGHLVAVVRLEPADRVEHAGGVLVGEEVARDDDIVRRLPNRLAHLHGRPVVLLLPLDLAAERGGVLDDREHGHDGVEAQLGMAGGRQAGHQLAVAVGIRERRIHQVHQLHGRHRGRVAHRRAVHRLAAKRRQHPLPACHRLPPFIACPLAAARSASCGRFGHWFIGSTRQAPCRFPGDRSAGRAL